MLKHGHEIEMLGMKEGEVAGHKILTGKPVLDDIDTVTMYVSPRNQPAFYEYVLKLKPRRVVFNPGAENPEFEEVLQKNNIEALEACTLVMLSIGNY